MKKYAAYIKSFLALLLLGVVFGFSSKKNASRLVKKDVKISFSNEDNLFITHQMVNNLLIQKEESVVNQPKTLINLQGLESRVESHPMVSSANVSVGITGDLEVSIVQRKPLARLYNANDVVYIDAKGLEMPLSKNYSARVPVVDNRNGLIDTKTIFPLIQKINEDSFLTQLVTSIKKDEEGVWLQTRYHQQQILLGELHHLNNKLKKIKVFYNYMSQDSLSGTFTKLDLQYNNQVVCSK